MVRGRPLGFGAATLPQPRSRGFKSHHLPGVVDLTTRHGTLLRLLGYCTFAVRASGGSGGGLARRGRSRSCSRTSRGRRGCGRSTPSAMRDALARHDEILRDAVEEARRRRREDDRRRPACGVRERAERRSPRSKPAGSTSEDWRRARTAARADGHPHRRRRVARRRLLRHRGEPGRADRGAGPRGSDRRVARNADLVRDDPVGRSRSVDLGEHRLRDLGRPEHIFQLATPGLRDDFPPLRSLDAYPGQPARAAHELRRARARAGRGVAPLLDARAAGDAHRRRRHRQDAPRAPGGRRRARRIPGRRLVRRARRRCSNPALVAAARAPRSALRERARARSRTRSLARICATSSSCSCSTTASTWSTPCAELVDAAARRVRRRCASSRRAARRSASRARRLSRCRRCRCRLEHGDGARARCCDYEAVRLFVERAQPVKPGFVLTERRRAGRRRDLPPARRHPARHRARGRAVAACWLRPSIRAGSTTASGCSPAADAPRSAPADAARRDRLELRAPRPGRAAPLRSAVGLRGRVHARGSRGRRLRGDRRRRPRPAGAPRRQVAGRHRRHRRPGSATACSRRCVTTPWSAWVSSTTPLRREPGTRPTSSPRSRRPARCCGAPTTRPVSPGSRPSRTTFAPRSGGPAFSPIRRRSCASSTWARLLLDRRGRLPRNRPMARPRGPRAGRGVPR